MIVNSAIVLLIANQAIVEWSTERKTKRQGALDNVETSVYILNVYSGNEWKYRWKTFSLVSHIKGFAEDYFNHISDQMNGYVDCGAMVNMCVSFDVFIWTLTSNEID